MSTNYNVQLKDPENTDNFWFPITLKGNVTDLTIFDSTHYSTAGLVPASGGDSDKFLCADGSWKQVSGSGGTDTHYYTTLNGSTYGDTSAVNLGSWYAPAYAGSQYALLTSSGSGAPSWTLPTLASGQTTGLLKYTSGSGWSLHSFPTFYATNSIGTSSWATDLQDITFTSGTGINLGIATGNLTINIVGAPRSTNGIGGINVGTEANPSTITEATSGAYYAVQTNSSNKAFVRVPSSGSFPNIGQGLYLNTSTNTLQLNLPVYPLGYATSDLGGIRTVGGIVGSGGYVVASSGTYYPVQTDSSGVAMVKVPSGGGTATTVNVVSGSGLTKSTSGNTVTLGLNASTESGQGALLTTADVIPENVYINKDDVVAIPIFYGNGSDTSDIYEADEGIYPSEPKKEGFTGHYVNLHDIINGLIREPLLLRILSIALGIKPKQ